METRYEKNIGYLFSTHDQNVLLNSTIGVLGCGGNGGYVIDFLARLGCEKLIIFDGDTFEESNLNRQLFCNMKTLGENKAEVAAKWVEKVNPTVGCWAYSNYFSQFEADLQTIKTWCDIVFLEQDYTKVDPYKMRSYLRNYIENGGICVGMGNSPLGGNSSVFTKDDLDFYDKLTTMIGNEPINIPVAQPAYICAMSAALDVALGVKALCNKPYAAMGETVSYDLYHNKMVVTDRFGIIY